MLTKAFGSLLGAPLMAVLWVQAIKAGGAGLGLPYFVSAVSGMLVKVTWFLEGLILGSLCIPSPLLLWHSLDFEPTHEY